MRVYKKKDSNLLLLSAIVTVFFIRYFSISTFAVTFNSMIPTLVNGDKIIANNFVYLISKPKRGDVVIVQYPFNKKKLLIKRIIGLPGETIKIENGHLFIDGRRQDGSKNFRTDGSWEYGKSGQEIYLSNDNYFLLGDNDKESADSRVWGPVSRNNLRGKVVMIYWPSKRVQKIQ